MPEWHEEGCCLQAHLFDVTKLVYQFRWQHQATFICQPIPELEATTAPRFDTKVSQWLPRSKGGLIHCSHVIPRYCGAEASFTVSDSLASAPPDP